MANYLIHRKLLLSRGAKPNSLDRELPIIFSAISVDSSAIVQAIIDFKGDLECCDRFKRETPLLWAAAQGSLSCVKLLLKVANTAATDFSGRGVLSIAICYRQLAVVEILLQHPEVDVTLCDKKGMSPLRHAVREGQPNVVKALLENPQVDASMRDAANEGILHYAVERDHWKVVSALLSCESVTRSSRRLKDGYSPIHCAVRCTDWRTFLDYVGDDGESVFSVAAPSRKVLGVLLESGLFDVNAVDGNGMTALHHVCMLESGRCWKPECFISGPDSKDDYGARGDIILDLFSVPEINLDVVDLLGETPLYKAVHARNIGHMRVLMAKGASLHVKGAKQITCTLGRSCKENPVTFRDLGDFEAHLTKCHGELFI